EQHRQHFKRLRLDNGICWLTEIRFFFSSRRRHTRWPRDWSSDVCSSDLDEHVELHGVNEEIVGRNGQPFEGGGHRLAGRLVDIRSEERRVGKSVDLGGRRIIKKKKKRTWVMLLVLLSGCNASGDVSYDY